MKLTISTLLVCVAIGSVTAKSTPSPDVSKSHKEKSMFERISQKIDDLYNIWKLYKEVDEEFIKDSKTESNFFTNIGNKLEEFNKVKEMFKDLHDLTGISELSHNKLEKDNTWSEFKDLYNDFSEKELNTHTSFIHSIEKKMAELIEAREFFQNLDNSTASNVLSQQLKKVHLKNYGTKIDELHRMWNLFKDLHYYFSKDKPKSSKGIFANIEKKMSELNEARKLYQDLHDIIKG